MFKSIYIENILLFFYATTLIIGCGFMYQSVNDKEAKKK